MDDDFLEELDRRVSNVSLDRYWERAVGGWVLWLAPVDYLQSIRIKETLRADNPNVVDETKRMTLAGAIVGIGRAPSDGGKADVLDLRPKRGEGKVFKVVGKSGKDELVDLPEYIYRKTQNWDAEFIDAAFDVFSDVMESHRKELVKDVVFENAKDPRDELAELEAKVAELRQGMGMPPLVEARRLDEEPPSPADVGLPEEEPPAPAGEADFAPVPPPRRPIVEEDFDPFAAVGTPERASAPAGPPPPPPVPPEPQQTFAVPVPPSRAVSQPPQEAEMSPIERELAARRSGAPRPAALVTPDGKVPHYTAISAPGDVLESPAERVQVPPPRVDRGTEAQNRNPRFARPQR